MDHSQIALVAAGLIGVGTALIHGVLMQRAIIAPLATELAQHPRASSAMKKLVGVLLHFTTANWLISGAMLVLTALWFGEDARRLVGLLAASSFAYGGLGLLWAVRRFHPGWALMMLACGLIAVGLT
ncbi:MAG: hypothetical protein DI629_11175 [Mesorhizobium amorphae]|nr:MAG: hypothetical protein DI629_11175 [Mesorhizobium amorphae]